MYFSDKSNSDNCNSDGYEKLGDAIILQAVKDYRLAVKSLKSSPNNTTASDTKHEVERFFHSGLFATITELDPDMLISMLNQEVKSL